MVYRICCFLSNGEGTFITPALYLRKCRFRRAQRAQEVRALAREPEIHLGGQAREPVLCLPQEDGIKGQSPFLPPKEIRADCWEAASLGVSDAQEALERLSGRPLGSCLPCIPRWPRAVARRASGSLINHSVAPHGDQPTAPHLSSLTCRILTLKRSMAFPWRGAPGLPKVGSRNHLSLHVELLGFAVSLPGAQT